MIHLNQLICFNTYDHTPCGGVVCMYKEKEVKYKKMQSKYILVYESPSSLFSNRFIFHTWHEMFNFIKKNSTYGCYWHIIIDFI